MQVTRRRALWLHLHQRIVNDLDGNHISIGGVDSFLDFAEGTLTQKFAQFISADHFLLFFWGSRATVARRWKGALSSAVGHVNEN